MDTAHPPITPGRPVREPLVALDDLTGSLLWPKLLRAPALALRIERVLAGVACVVTIGLLGRISGLWNDEATFGELVGMHVVGPLASVVELITPWGGRGIPLGSTARTLLYAPVNLLVADPAALLLLGVPMLIVWGVLGVMISRSVASEVSLGRVLRWEPTLGFALSKWLGALGAMLAPVLLVALAHLVIAVGGAALFTWPVGDVIGAVLYGVALLVAVLAVLVALGFLLGWPMLLPAIACEGTDALDAIQRVYAYVIGRPLRLVLYGVIVTLTALIALGVVGWVLSTGESLATTASAQWSGTRGAQALQMDTLPRRVPDPALAEVGGTGLEEAGGTVRAAHAVVGFWRSLLTVLIAGYVVSLIHTGGTLLYLLCRRINDGQEIAELWTPDAR